MAGEVSQIVPDFKWTPQRERAALAVAVERTETAAATAAGCARKTICRLMREPVFVARVREHLRPAKDLALIELERAAPEAARTIVDLSVYGLPGHTTRLAAAKDVLDRIGVKPTDKVEISGKDGGPLVVKQLSGVSVSDL